MNAVSTAKNAPDLKRKISIEGFILQKIWSSYFDRFGFGASRFSIVSIFDRFGFNPTRADNDAFSFDLAQKKAAKNQSPPNIIKRSRTNRTNFYSESPSSESLSNEIIVENV